MASTDLEARIRAGDVDGAIASMYATHHRELRRFVRAHVRSRDRADDVCQEVWEAARQALPRFRLDATPRAWLFAIARHKLADARRRERSHDTLESSVLRGGPLGALLGVRTPPTPSSELRRHERAQTLHRVLAALAADERELLELRFVAGMKPADIVEALGLEVRPNTLSQRIVRLVHRLREALAREEAFASSGSTS